MYDKKQEYLEEFDPPEDSDELNAQYDDSFFEGIMSEIKRINTFFQGIYYPL